MYSYIGKSFSNDCLGSSTDPCCIQNRVIMNRIIKKLRCIRNVRKIIENLRGVSTNMPISQLLTILEYITRYLINARA